MKKFICILLSLSILAMLSACDGATESVQTESVKSAEISTAKATPSQSTRPTPTLKPSPIPALTEPVSLFPTDSGINKLLESYNNISERKISPEIVSAGNIKSKAHISFDEAYIEIVNSSDEFITIRIDAQTDSDDALFNVFHDFAIALNSSITDDDLETAWIDIQENLYEIDYNRTGTVETYELGGIQMEYMSGLYGKPSVNMHYWMASPTPTPAPALTATPTPEPTQEAALTLEPVEQMVWIPTNGGTKYHSISSCSGMNDPQQVPLSSAEAQGFTPCKKCH